MNAKWHGIVRKIQSLTNEEMDLWRRLTATRNELRNPYFSLEFNQSVAAAFPRVRVLVLWEGRQLAGFFPFRFETPLDQMMGSAQQIGGRFNDYSGVIIDPSRHGPLTGKDLLRCAKLSRIAIRNLEGSQTFLGLSKRLEVVHGGRIILDHGQEAYWNQIKDRHRGFYNTLKQQERRIEREFSSVDFKFSCDDPEEVLSKIMEAKREQYKRKGFSDTFDNPSYLQCLERIVAYRAGRCIPTISVLRFDGEWAAYHFGVSADRTLHYWFPVYNAKFERVSPGIILLSKIIDNAAQYGLVEIDLGVGLHEYKNKMATELYQAYNDVFEHMTLRGLVYRGLKSVLWRTRKLRSLYSRLK